MPHGLPTLPTTVVGSYAHPSWFYAAKELMEADRFGPVAGQGPAAGPVRADDVHPPGRALHRSHPTRGGVRELGAGIIDIRTHYCETPDDVAERVRICLRHVPADKLFLTTDCGLRYLHRTLAREKITNLVAGVRMVRDEL